MELTEAIDGYLLFKATRASASAIRVLVTGKGSKQRYLYLGRRALQAVWLYLKQERPEPAQYETGHLFLTPGGYPMDRNSIRKAISRIRSRAGLHIYPIYSGTLALLRGCLRRGIDLMILKAFLGHEKVATTEKYLTALNNEDIEYGARKTSQADD